MFKSTILVGTLPKDCVGRWMKPQNMVWKNTDSLVTAWKSWVKKDIMECVFKIPSVQIDVINGSLALYNSD